MRETEQAPETIFLREVADLLDKWRRLLRAPKRNSRTATPTLLAKDRARRRAHCKVVNGPINPSSNLDS